MTTVTDNTNAMTTFRIRLPKQDVDDVRRLARAESHRLGKDICWTILLRGALKRMATEQSLALRHVLNLWAQLP